MSMDESHDAMKVVRIERGWETGVARCLCGREFPVTFSVTHVRGRERIVVNAGQRCPDDTGPEHRAEIDQRFAEWWENAGRRVRAESSRKGQSYLAFCAGVRYGFAQDAPIAPQSSEAQPRAGSAPINTSSTETPCIDCKHVHIGTNGYCAVVSDWGKTTQQTCLCRASYVLRPPADAPGLDGVGDGQ